MTTTSRTATPIVVDGLRTVLSTYIRNVTFSSSGLFPSAWLHLEDGSVVRVTPAVGRQAQAAIT